ncbi:MAG: SDR family oxidoreductase [Burkholderiales bacterium]
MRRLLIVGCGDIALRTLPLLESRYCVFGLSRNLEHAQKLRRRKITPLIGDLDAPKSLARLAGIGEYVLHFCPPKASGAEDTRTRNLLAVLSSGGSLPRRLLYISTTGVYGNCGGEVVPETHPAAPRTARAIRRLDAESRLRDWGKRNRVAVIILRVPGIYAADRLPLDRIRRQTPVLRDEDDVYTNHIHADDLARIVIAALESGSASRIYNVCDDSELKMAEYFDLVAQAHGFPAPPRISLAEAQSSLPENLLSFMRESRRLSNARMRSELRVRLHYPTVHEGLARS